MNRNERPIHLPRTPFSDLKNRIWWDGRLVPDFENFNFLHLEILRTREKRLPVQSGVVGVTFAKDGCVTASVCVAVTGNTNVTIEWTQFGIT
jgi:hypothetical protein